SGHGPAALGPAPWRGARRPPMCLTSSCQDPNRTKLDPSRIPVGVTQHREPILNVPAAGVALPVACVVVHLVRVYVLTEEQDIDFLVTFAFIPARFDSSIALGGTLPGGWAAD